MSNPHRGNGNSDEELVAVVGAGAWGTTLSRMISMSGRAAALITRDAERALELSETRENRVFLPGVEIPGAVDISHEIDRIIPRATIVLIVVPSQELRAVAVQLESLITDNCIIVSCAKGLEHYSLLRMTEVVAEATSLPKARICALSGPNLAREIATGLPASTVVACSSMQSATKVQKALSTPTFRVYTSTDVVGVEHGGALKNIVALAAGAVDGLGVGHNAKAALISRGLAEITRLGVAAGANPVTFGGLSGLGDLIATCESPLSRNRTFGEQLGKGIPVSLAAGSSPHVVEGIAATRAAVRLSSRLNVEMPIAAAVNEVLEGRASVQDAVTSLMTRAFRTEFDS